METPPPREDPTLSPPATLCFHGNASSKVNKSASKAAPEGHKTLSTVPDLRDWASSNVDSLKRHLDSSHSEILNDIEACRSRLYKRFKSHSQQCQQVADEAEKEYKKMSERITESQEAMQASYVEFLAEAQASASRVCKSSIPEMLQSFNKSIDALRNRCGLEL